MKNKILYIGVVLGIMLCQVGVTAVDYIQYKIAGGLQLRGESVLEQTMVIHRHKKNDHLHILKLKRNTLDSRFLTKDRVLEGWIDIPIPIPFIQDVRKKYQVRYQSSDNDWDYFVMNMGN